MRLQFFSPTEAEILTVLTERMVGADFPDVVHAPTVTTIDAFVAGLPLNLRVLQDAHRKGTGAARGIKDFERVYGVDEVLDFGIGELMGFVVVGYKVSEFGF